DAFTNPLWERIRARQDVFHGVFAWAGEPFNISPHGQRHQIAGLWVSGDFFRVLGVQPALGRVFTSADDRRGCGLAPGAVVSYGFWQSQFAGDSSAIGRSFSIEGHPLQIIGVTPPEFFGLETGRTFDVALPICAQPALQSEGRLDSGTTWWLSVMARLKPGRPLQQASAVMRDLSPAIFQSSLPAGYPSDSVKPYLNMKLLVSPSSGGISRLRDRYSTPLTLLLAIAGLVLVIACANLANLMLARASARRREMAVRLALGASRARLAQQLLMEGLLLAFAGVALGILLAQALSRFLVSFLMTSDDPTFVNLRLDWRVFAFSALLGLLTCLLFSLAPALQAARTDPGDALKSGSRSMTSGRDRVSLRRILVVMQIALSVVLLVGALLFVRSLRNLVTLDPGFDPRGVLIADVNFSGMHLPPGRAASFHDELVRTIRAIPGVASAAQTTIVPVTGASWENRVWMEDSDFQHARAIKRSMVGAAYFRTLKTSLLAGREFDQRDSNLPQVAIVNQTFARLLTAGRNPVGLRFWIESTPYAPQTIYEIVGLVQDAKYGDLREESQALAYLPLAGPMLGSSGARILIRSGIRTEALVSALRTALAGLSPEIGYSFRLFDTQIQDSLLRERLMATLSALFGALAAALTAVGLYGVISYTVARRTSEIGIRLALGASRWSVIALTLREAAAVLAAGLGAGAILSLAGGRSAAALLYGVKSYDVSTLVTSAVAITLVTAAATYLPARRASSLNPAITLRQE
ncbi:MAG TPA: ABC transporter permease, partial [Candidatus Sulfopaludibacter sp.]|nr:ABC transporter permease [Candidatus Sulfopaludibacter sp.]